MRGLILTAAVAALTIAGFAHADTPAAKPKPSCFFTQDWSSWRSPDEKTIYLQVNVSDIYQISLSSGSSLLMEPDSHLINEVWGTNSVCTPLDLDLKVANDGFVVPLFVKSIAKLTPEQVAAIPKKYRP